MSQEETQPTRPATPPVEPLARLLHTTIQGVVSNYKEWDALEDSSRKVFMTQAQGIFDAYALIPLDSAPSCSGCRTLTEALNGLDEARREVVELQSTREASARPTLELCSCSAAVAQPHACCATTAAGPCICSGGPHVGLEMDAHYKTEQICKEVGQPITPALFNGIRGVLHSVLAVSEERRQYVHKFRKATMALATVSTEEEIDAMITVLPGIAKIEGRAEEAVPLTTLLQLVINTKGV